jgi:hypothetical protein
MTKNTAYGNFCFDLFLLKAGKVLTKELLLKGKAQCHRYGNKK